MKSQWNRRDVLRGLTAISTAALVTPKCAVAIDASDPQAEIQITPVSEQTIRLSLLPTGLKTPIPFNGSLVKESWGTPVIPNRRETDRELSIGSFRLKISWNPISIAVADEHHKVLQVLDWDANTGALTFVTGTSPLYGLGEGGPQFDRRGSTDAMRSGQGGYKLATHGGRVPIPWIIGASGWAIFFHQPFGAFDFTGSQSKFMPTSRDAALPLDLFLVASSDPSVILAEYAKLTGFAEMPPLWSLGYQQSHRTLASREEVIAEAKLFREKKLRCDALIYLGTG